MSHHMVSRRYEPPGKKLTRLMFILAAVSLLSAIYLWVVHWFYLDLPDRDAIIASNWSSTFRIPVSTLAVPVYGTMLLMLTLIGAHMPQILQWVAWRVLLVCAFLSGMAAVWFITLQFVATKDLCIICLISQFSALALAGIIWFRGPNRPRRTNPSRTDPVKIHRGVIYRLGATSALCMALLIVGQLTSVRWTPGAFPDSTAVAGGASTGSGGLPTSYTGPAGITSEETGRSRSLFTASGGMQLPEGLRSESADATQSSAASAPFELLRGLNDPVKAPTPPPTTEVASNLKEEVRNTPVAAPDMRNLLQEIIKDEGIRIARYMGGALHITVQDHPTLGKSSAKHVVTFFVDYTLRECRERNAYLEQIRRRYGDQIAIVPIFSPLNPKCNQYVETEAGPEQANACEYAKLALAVWRARPEQFEQFHNWLMRGGDVVPLPVARAYAAQLVGPGPLQTALDDESVSTRLRRDTAIYQDSGRGYLPKMLFEATEGSAAFQIGKVPPNSEAALFKLLEERLRVMPVTGQ